VSFHNDTSAVETTPYRERATFNPFGPVDNGSPRSGTGCGTRATAR
jgi:hypothetical protein